MSDTQLGLGVMIKMLGGNADSVAAFESGLNKQIVALYLGTDDALHFIFSGGHRMKLYDAGQSCCENRYMRTDDDLSYYVGATLLGATVEDAPEGSAGDDISHEVHEVQFLHVKTSKGTFTMSTHNEHNGYYGGFYVVAAVEGDDGR